MISYNTDIGTTTPRIIQFENANEGRSYPFEDNTQLVDIHGATLPDSIISDMHIVLPESMTASLSSVYLSDFSVSLCVQVMSGATQSGALSILVKRDELVPYSPYRLEKLAGSEDIGGIVTFGMVDSSPARGSFRFTPGQVNVARSALAYYKPAALRKIIDPRTGESLNGNVRIDFSSCVSAEKTESGIKLSLKDGAASMLLSKCDRERPVNACGATPINSINGVKPDDKNRLVIWFH